MAISSEMEELAKAMGDAGCRFYGLAAKALNDAIMLVNDNRLTKQQYVMFALADMMTHVEVGASMARKAMNLNKTGNPGAEKIKAMSRIFANNTAQLVAQNKAMNLNKTGNPGAEKIKAMSRIFANHTAQLVAQNILKILKGSGVFDQQTVSEFMETRLRYV
jgi:alkylation response protein AidB-like acyl-CoA dehydrogenase